MGDLTLETEVKLDTEVLHNLKLELEKALAQVSLAMRQGNNKEAIQTLDNL